MLARKLHLQSKHALFLDCDFTLVDRYANLYPCYFMLSRDLGHVLLHLLQFVDVLLGLVPDVTRSIPNCGLIRADEGPITSLFHALFLLVHLKDKLTFLLLLLLHYIVSFQLTQMQNI